MDALKITVCIYSRCCISKESDLGKTCGLTSIIQSYRYIKVHSGEVLVIRVLFYYTVFNAFGHLSVLSPRATLLTRTSCFIISALYFNSCDHAEESAKFPSKVHKYAEFLQTLLSHVHIRLNWGNIRPSFSLSLKTWMNMVLGRSSWSKHACFYLCPRS